VTMYSTGNTKNEQVQEACSSKIPVSVLFCYSRLRYSLSLLIYVHMKRVFDNESAAVPVAVT
jgi:hypothetical protein